MAILLDHAKALNGTIQGIRRGCNGVMIDGSDKGFTDNIDLTREVVKMAHSCGIPVEAELGCVPDADAQDGLRLTSVEEAKAFVQRTDVDFLAVSIGTLHGSIKGRLRLDSSRLRQINEALSIPLVIHGGTGLSETQIQRLVSHGASKINFFSALDEAAGEALSSDEKRFTDRVRQAQQVIAVEALRYIRLCGAAGRAAEVLTQCRPSQPVEHLIIFNLAKDFDPLADDLMARGRKVLSGIPGVRKVITGKAVKEEDRYRFCWLVRFASPEVIDSYRNHPDHVAYANKYFRPYAGDRISIDYLL